LSAMKLKSLFLGAVLAALAASSLYMMTLAYSGSKSLVNLKDSGMKAPEFPKSTRWLNSEEGVTMAKLKGKVVVLDFWTYCCINCLHALPALKKIEEHYENKPIAVLGIHSGKFDQEKNDDKVKAAIDKYQVKHPVAMDDDYRIWDEWAVRAWPTIALIDAEGKIAVVSSGEPDFESLVSAIDKLLADGEKKGILNYEPAFKIKQAAKKSSELSFPMKILASEDYLFVSDAGANRVLKIGYDGKIVSVYGGGAPGFKDGKIGEALFNEPQGLALYGGFLFVADRGNHAIRKIDLATGETTTVAGTGKKGELRIINGTEALRADLRSPWDVAFYASNLYVAMAGSHQIWKLDLKTGRLHLAAGSGVESIIDGAAGYAAFAQPTGLCVEDETMYVTDSETSAIRAVNLKDFSVKTIVGKGLFDFGKKDGDLKSALLQHPMDAKIRNGKLYVADSFNNSIRVVSLGLEGKVETLKIDGITPLNEPAGLSVFKDKMYIVDTNNGRIVVYDFKNEKAEALTITK